MSDVFKTIVGQRMARSKAQFYIDGFSRTSMIPHLMLTGERGCGKTEFAKQIARNLVVGGKGKHKKILDINCVTIKGLRHFVEEIVLDHVVNNEATMIFDEASELPKDVTMAMLSILNPNAEHRNVFRYQDYQLEFDFRKHSFIFATTEPQQIFHALMNRCKRIDLEPYTVSDISTILQRKIPQVKFKEDVLNDIASTARLNPRCAQIMADDIASYCEQSSSYSFGKASWKSLRKTLGIYPLGLHSVEFQILRVLKEFGKTKLTDIASKVGQTTEAVRRDYEIYLVRQGLMEFDGSLRLISKKGAEVFKEAVELTESASL